MESLTLIKGKSVNSELEFQDEPMDVNETATDRFGEEGEINVSDDEKSNTEQLPSSVTNTFKSNYNTTQIGDLFTGFNAINKDEEQKKLDRAKRFSLPRPVVKVEEIYEEKLRNLHRELGIDNENERHYRFNAIHMRGTENMSTDDVLQYFLSFAPAHVEWINDVSCNIVWLDDISAAKALLNLSRKIKNLNKVHLNADPFEKDYKNNYLNEEADDGDGVDAREIQTAIPPGVWRIGMPCEKSSFLLLRYATRSDKKQRNAEKNSEYYKKYGNPHYGNIPGLISNSLRSGARKYKFKTLDSTGSAVNQGTKQNPWEELAYEWGKRDERYVRSSVARATQISDLRISLTNKKEQAKRLREDLEVNLNYSKEESWESRSKIPRMKMYADDEEKRLVKNSEKKFLINRFKKQPEDLRSKINKKKRQPRYKFSSEKEAASESSITEDEYDDGDSGDWAFEHYHDLRQSLVQNKRHEIQYHNARRFESDSEGGDNRDDYFYERDFNRRSPLQIEIENDEYYHKKV